MLPPLRPSQLRSTDAGSSAATPSLTSPANACRDARETLESTSPCSACAATDSVPPPPNRRRSLRPVAPQLRCSSPAPPPAYVPAGLHPVVVPWSQTRSDPVSSTSGAGPDELRWMGSDGETSSTRSYRDVVGSASASSGREPAATPPPALVPAAARLPASARIGPRSEMHRVERAPLVDADGFQQPRRKNRRREPRRTAPPPPRRSPSPARSPGPRRACPGSGTRTARSTATAARTRPPSLTGRRGRQAEAAAAEQSGASRGASSDCSAPRSSSSSRRSPLRRRPDSRRRRPESTLSAAAARRQQYNLYLKQAMKQLNIEDLQSNINSTHKQEVASNEGDAGNENTSHDVITEEEENGPILSDEELGTHQSEVKEGEPVSGNAADDDDDVFDWY